MMGKYFNSEFKSSKAKKFDPPSSCRFRDKRIYFYLNLLILETLELGPG